MYYVAVTNTITSQLPSNLNSFNCQSQNLLAFGTWLILDPVLSQNSKLHSDFMSDIDHHLHQHWPTVYISSPVKVNLFYEHAVAS